MKYKIFGGDTNKYNIEYISKYLFVVSNFWPAAIERTWADSTATREGVAIGDVFNPISGLGSEGTDLSDSVA